MISIARIREEAKRIYQHIDGFKMINKVSCYVHSVGVVDELRHFGLGSILLQLTID